MIHSPDYGYNLVHMSSNNIALKFNYSKILRPTFAFFNYRWHQVVKAFGQIYR